MNPTVQITVTGRKTSEVVAKAAKLFTTASRALRKMDMRKCASALRHGCRALASEKACIAVMAVAALSMWLLIALDAADTAVATAAACALPWISVMAIRDFRNNSRKGGEL